MPLPLTFTRHALDQFREHVADWDDPAIRDVMNQVHRQRVLLTAQDPKYPDTPFYWGTHAGRDFALAIGTDRDNAQGEYVATTIGLGHLERILRTRRARQESVQLGWQDRGEAATKSRLTPALTSKPFQDLSANVEESFAEWPTESSRLLSWNQPPVTGNTDAWAQIWRWLDRLAGVRIAKLEFNPIGDPPGWWATLRAGQREPRLFIGHNAMAELYILDQPAKIVAFPDPDVPGRLRVVPLTAGHDSQPGLPGDAREAPYAASGATAPRRSTVRALYPGTFDPITKGHLHLLTRACQLFETVVIAAADNTAKSTVFSLEERLDLIRKEVEAVGLHGIEVTSYKELTVDFAVAQGCQAIVRGLRAVSDYEYEVQMAIINRNIAPQVDTVFLMADQDHSFISSSIIKDILIHGGGIDRVAGMVSPTIATELQQRLLPD